MTQIQIRKSESQIHLIGKGHAGYSNPGTDIVCAGISTLIYSWVEECENLEKDGYVKIERMVVEPGEVDIEIAVCDERVHWAFSVIEIGLGILAENYPKHAKIVWGEIEK